jgi:hypothetical protein
MELIIVLTLILSYLVIGIFQLYVINKREKKKQYGTGISNLLKLPISLFDLLVLSFLTVYWPFVSFVYAGDLINAFLDCLDNIVIIKEKPKTK